jgi:hypothetical protein
MLINTVFGGFFDFGSVEMGRDGKRWGWGKSEKNGKSLWKGK